MLAVAAAAGATLTRTGVHSFQVVRQSQAVD